MHTPGQPSDHELGIEFLDAFDEAVGAYMESKTLHDTPGFYDPCGDIEKRFDEKLHETLRRLIRSIRDIK